MFRRVAPPPPEDRDVDLPELLREVRRIEVQSRRLVTEVMAGGYNTVFRGRGVEFDEVREYTEGDDPRTVDWGVTARMGRPFVRKYVDERDLTVIFLLDLSRSMTGGFGIWSARQTAARILACLALSAVRNNDRVGLVTFGAGIGSFVPPARGAGHVLRIIRDCLAVPSSRGGTDLHPPLEFLGRVARRRAVVFLLSDFLAPLPARPLAAAARRHDLVAVRLLVPELRPRAADAAVRLRDPETGRSRLVDLRSKAVHAALAARAAELTDAAAEALRRAGVDLMDVPVPRSRNANAIAGPILRFFRMREGRRGHR